jgi:trans-aconitate methyltransferase
LLSLILCILVLCMLSIVYYTWRLGISPMPSTRLAQNEMFKMIPELKPGQIVELGSGWGSLLLPIAKKYPDRQIVAYEKSFIPYWISRLRILCSSSSNIEVYKSDFFQEDLSKAALVLCYLYPDAMQKLDNKLDTELSTGACILSNTFRLPSWDPHETRELNDLYNTHLYLYYKS